MSILPGRIIQQWMRVKKRQVQGSHCHHTRPQSPSTHQTPTLLLPHLLVVRPAGGCLAGDRPVTNDRRPTPGREWAEGDVAGRCQRQCGRRGRGASGDNPGTWRRQGRPGLAAGGQASSPSGPPLHTCSHQGHHGGVKTHNKKGLHLESFYGVGASVTA